MADPFRGLERGGGSAVGGRGGEFHWNESTVRDLLSEHGPIAGYLDGVVGPKVVQEAKRRAPVSADGSNGRPLGYLRSSIGQQLGSTGGHLHVDIGVNALTPDGTDYGLIMEVGSAPHVIESGGDYPLRDKHGNVFGKSVHHPGTRPHNYL